MKVFALLVAENAGINICHSPRTALCHTPDKVWGTSVQRTSWWRRRAQATCAHSQQTYRPTLHCHTLSSHYMWFKLPVSFRSVSLAHKIRCNGGCYITQRSNPVLRPNSVSRYVTVIVMDSKYFRLSDCCWSRLLLIRHWFIDIVNSFFPPCLSLSICLSLSPPSHSYIRACVPVSYTHLGIIQSTRFNSK